MTLTPEQVRDVSRVMDVAAEMIPFLGRLEYPDHMLNPWSRVLGGVLGHLDLGPASRVLDLPCGMGGVSVLVAQQFGAAVVGVDVLEDHVERARAFAAREGCGERCSFRTGDVRVAVARERGYDALLWIAGPPVWTEPEALLGALRPCVRPGGTLFVAEAYRPDDVPPEWCPGVHPLARYEAAFAARGDTVSCLLDPPIDWEADNALVCRAAEALHATLEAPAERAVLERYLAHLRGDLRRDTQELGTALWSITRRADRAG